MRSPWLSRASSVLLRPDGASAVLLLPEHVRQRLGDLDKMNRLVRLGAEALKPQQIAGKQKWHSPLVSRRKANVLRKRALRDGSFGSVVMDSGQCDIAETRHDKNA